MSKHPNSTSQGVSAVEIDKKNMVCDNLLITQEGISGGMHAGTPAAENSCHSLQKRLESITETLKVRETELAEANATVKVLLRQREMDREEFKEKMVCAINEMIRPYLEKLAKRKIGPEEKALVAVLQQNLEELVSPVPSRLPAELGRLSPPETLVIHLIVESPKKPLQLAMISFS